MSNYKGIFKGTLLFGSVQVFQILISLIRGKAAALFIGAVGMGLNGIYTSSLAMLITIAGLGVNLSGMRYTAALNRDDPQYLEKIRYVYRIYILLAIIGAALTVLLSYPLSQISFGDSEHVAAYLVLSLYVAATLYTSGGVAILQGMGELKRIAVGNVLPAAVGLLATLPLYYFWGVAAVVPALIVVPFLSSCYLSFILHQLLSLDQTPIAWPYLLSLFRDFISLGIVTVLAALLGNFSMFGINSFIAQTGSIADVGFYQAGTSITNQYVGMVFSAMSMDYFPRLSRICSDLYEMRRTVNEQGEITILMAWPLLAIMIVSAPILIHLLLSSEFLVINSFIQIIALGMIFKAASFPLGFLSFAKGDKKTFFCLEGVAGNIINVSLCLIGYYLDGLHGVAICFLINYCVYFILVFVVDYYRYQYCISTTYVWMLSLATLTLILDFFLASHAGVVWQIASVVTTCIITGISIYMLNQRVGLVAVLKRKFHLL